MVTISGSLAIIVGTDAFFESNSTQGTRWYDGAGVNGIKEALEYLGGYKRSLSKFRNTPKALISGQKAPLFKKENADFFQ